jgi:hypothetical protein
MKADSNIISQNSSLIIDREQAKTQLEMLGYKPGENVYMRFFVPDSDPRQGTKEAARKADKLNWEQVERLQKDGYGVYFVVNGGGHTDKDIKVGRALFCEWDDRPIEDQIQAWRNLKLPEPSMQVATRKSAHNYWRADLSIDQWLELQQDLLIYTQSDQKLKNPSRVLRLAGAWHIKPGCEPIRCDIVHQCDRICTYEELRAAIPRRQELEKPAISYQPSISDDVPLVQLLTKDNRNLIEQGAPQGSRNDSGAKLARNLIGTALRLDQLGIRFSGDPRQLFDDYCHRCNPPISNKEAESIWKSAAKGNPTSSLTDDALENCAKAWLRNQQKASGRSFSSGSSNRNLGGGSGGSGGGDGGDGGAGSNKILKFPGFQPAALEQITEEIDELIYRGISGSKLTAELNRLAAASQIYVGELRKLYHERLGESEIESDRTDNQTEIQSLLNFTEQSLSLSDYLPESLAQPITQWCGWLNIRPAVALTALLAGISSCHATGTELVLQRNQNFRVPSTVYAALVSPSGQKKSPIFNNIIRQPLLKLREEKVAAYEAAMADYEAELQDWEQSENKGPRPEKPKDPTLYYFTNATGEAIPVQASKAPEKALLALIDELSGYFNSSNAYRSGRGSDKQDLLSYFDGTGQTVLRAGGVRVDLAKIYLSIFGTIQPEILKNHMEDCSDPDGNWARFLLVNQPLQASVLHDDDGLAYQISDRLTHFYRLVDRLPEMEYRLSRRAFKAYQAVYDQLERLRVTHPKAGMRAVYSKMEGYIGRLALNLHVLWELEAGKECPSEEIPLHIIEKAIALAKFYMGQVKVLHSSADDESLPNHIAKLIELSKRLEANGGDGWVKAKIFCEQFRAKKRITAQQARQWMQEAVSLGYGRTKGDGNRLEYYWKRDNNEGDNNDAPPKPKTQLGETRGRVGEDVPLVETTEITGFEQTRGTRGSEPPSFPSEKTNGCFSVVEQEQEQACLEVLPAEEEESSLEGGILPLPSPSVPQEAQSKGTVGDSALGETRGTASPSVPQVPQVALISYSSDTTADEQMIINNNGSSTVIPELYGDNSQGLEEDFSEQRPVYSFERIIEFLEDPKMIPNREELCELQKSCSLDVIRTACQRLVPERRVQIENWLRELSPSPLVEKSSPLPSEKISAGPSNGISPLAAATLRIAAIAAVALASPAVASEKVNLTPPVPAIAQEITAQPTPAPVEQKIKPGSRVRYILKGMERYGMVGTVTAIVPIKGSTTTAFEIRLDYHPKLAKLGGHCRNLEATLSQVELVE